MERIPLRLARQGAVRSDCGRACRGRRANRIILLQAAFTAIASLLLATVGRTEETWDDYSAATLREQQTAVETAFGSDYRQVPLDVKAEFFEWQLWRYCRTPYEQVMNRSVLPETSGPLPRPAPGSDTSTWNGALLAALSQKYAVTKDTETLDRIASLVRGLRLFFAITGQPGLMARTMTADREFVFPEMRPAQGPNGEEVFVWIDPAKGTFNQVAGGYTALMLYAYDDLPVAIQQTARADLAAMALHLIDYEFKATHADGKRTTYGDLTPLVSGVGVPFNAQVAYAIVALAHAFPPEDVAQAKKINRQFAELRERHHCYYQDPLRHVIVPQSIAASPLLKGMNDRNHVSYAAFNGLLLERQVAQRNSRPLDKKFVYQLGQTLVHSRKAMENQGNALCDFQWCGLLTDPAMEQEIIHRRRESTAAAATRSLLQGVEQLRRFTLDRFVYPGEEVESAVPLWVDRRAVDDYCWKANPQSGWKPTGPATTSLCGAIDYLHAYWTMRYFRLDERPEVQRDHAAVINETAGWPRNRSSSARFVPAANQPPAATGLAPNSDR